MKNHLTPLGTCNPLPGQNSFLLITKGGALKLFFADPDGHWLERSISLDITENEDFITHAVFGLQPRGLLSLLLLVLNIDTPRSYDSASHIRYRTEA